MFPLFQSGGRLSSRPPYSSDGRQSYLNSARAARILSSMGRRGRSRVPGVLGLAPTLDPLGWAGGPLLPTPPELGEIYGQAARLVVLQRMRPALLQVRLMMADQWCKPVWLIDVRHSVVSARGDSYFEQPTASGISRESPGPYDSGNGLPLRWALLLVVQFI